MRGIIGQHCSQMRHYNPAARKKPSATKEQKRNCALEEMMQELPDLNWPLIPTKFHCPHKKCTSGGCTLLHSDQYAGGHIDEKHLKVVNLLVLEFSRGVWKQCWSQVSCNYLALSSLSTGQESEAEWTEFKEWLEFHKRQREETREGCTKESRCFI